MDFDILWTWKFNVILFKIFSVIFLFESFTPLKKTPNYTMIIWHPIYIYTLSELKHIFS